MGRRGGFPGLRLRLDQIARHHKDIEAALRVYFSVGQVWTEPRFATLTRAEVEAQLRDRLDEVAVTSVFEVLAALEAMFRTDYLARCRGRHKGELSRTLRDIHKRKSERASLEDEILEAWKQHVAGTAVVIGQLRGALKFRHWIAHGRYWEPRLGRTTYDFGDVFMLAESILDGFAFIDD